MPIYEYRCADCGHQDEHLQKVSEKPLSKCPACGKKTYKKQLSAAGFQLKGSGWYATDFKNKAAPPTGKKEEKKAEASSDKKAEPAAKEPAAKKPAKTAA
jgi:putative FmdB family regulatory protein